MIGSAVHETVAFESLVAGVLDEYRERLKRGEQPTVDEYANRHPEAADLLRNVLATFELLDLSLSRTGFAPEIGDADAGTLGDFRLIREVGRGGMGVVYEAEQISLNRRVALKVLPFAATMDPRQLQRFRNEAQAAACLHHANIVPVHGVGCERAVHFYAMQLIEGQSLAQVIAEIKEQEFHHRDTEDTEKRDKTVPRSSLCSLCLCGKKSSYFRHIAELIAQAANALEYAHSMGVVHRDIKPANLMLSSSPLPALRERGGGEGPGAHLWVTDFGLAKLNSADGMTMTGDLIGTLRYMSPEQALAKHGLVDHRTDVYSLGATLYELLTLRPAVDGADKQEILKRIAFEEPMPLRKIDKSIPAELETITLKALAKEPGERYGSAGELADDLRRWLGDQAIKAKPPGWRERSVKLLRRHRPIAWSVGSAAMAVLLILAGTIGYLLNDRAARQTQTSRAVGEVLRESERFQRERKIPQALDQAKKAQSILQSGAGTPDLQRQVHERLTDLNVVADMEQRSEFRKAHDDDVLAMAFRSIGIDVDGLPPDEAAALIRRRSVSVELAAVLDRWASAHRKPSGDERIGRWHRLREIARAADPDPLRTQLRQIVLDGNDPEKLKALLAETPLDQLSPATVLAFADAMDQKSDLGGPVQLLQDAVRRFPDDYYLNRELAAHLMAYRPQDTDLRLRYFGIAAALRPSCKVSRYMVGSLLQDKGLHVDAIGEYEACLRIDPEFAEAHERIGNALLQLRRYEVAEAAYRRAIDIDPNNKDALIGLGTVLLDQFRREEAETAFRLAIDRYPNWIKSFKPSQEPGSKTPSRFEDALIQNVLRDSSLAYAHGRLGEVLLDLGKYHDSLSHFKLCQQLGSKLPEWKYPSAQYLSTAERCVEIEGNLQAFLDGTAKPANVRDQIFVAGMCKEKLNRTVLAVKLYRDMFAANPKLADGLFGLRLSAASTAALAGCGKGTDAAETDDAERARLRQQALEWVAADLAIYQSQNLEPSRRPMALQSIRHVQRSADFAGVRDAAALAKLPEAERAGWQKLWVDVGDLLKRPEDTTDISKQPRP